MEIAHRPVMTAASEPATKSLVPVSCSVRCKDVSSRMTWSMSSTPRYPRHDRRGKVAQKDDNCTRRCARSCGSWTCGRDATVANSTRSLVFSRIGMSDAMATSMFGCMARALTKRPGAKGSTLNNATVSIDLPLGAEGRTEDEPRSHDAEGAHLLPDRRWEAAKRPTRRWCSSRNHRPFEDGQWVAEPSSFAGGTAEGAPRPRGNVGRSPGRTEGGRGARWIPESGRLAKRMKTLRGLTPCPSDRRREPPQCSGSGPENPEGGLCRGQGLRNGGVLMSMGQPCCEARRPNRRSATCPPGLAARLTYRHEHPPHPFAVITADTILPRSPGGPERLRHCGGSRRRTAQAEGRGVNPRSVFMRFADRAGFRRIIALPSHLGPPIEDLRTEVGGESSGQRCPGIPRASAVLLLNDDELGYPFAASKGR